MLVSLFVYIGVLCLRPPCKIDLSNECGFRRNPISICCLCIIKYCHFKVYVHIEKYNMFKLTRNTKSKKEVRKCNTRVRKNRRNSKL